MDSKTIVEAYTLSRRFGELLHSFVLPVLSRKAGRKFEEAFKCNELGDALKETDFGRNFIAVCLRVASN